MNHSISLLAVAAQGACLLSTLSAAEPGGSAEARPAANGAGAATLAKIKAPFSLKWGETPERLEQLLTEAKAKIVSRTRDGQGELWKVEGLVQGGLRETDFWLGEGGLTAVLLIYQLEDAAKYEAVFQTARKRTEVKFGPPSAEEEAGGDIAHRCVWRKAESAMSIALFRVSEEKPEITSLQVRYEEGRASK